MNSAGSDPCGPGFPIRTFQDHSSVTNSPGLFAGSHVLHRLLTPRHPPCALCGLIAPTGGRRRPIHLIRPHLSRCRLVVHSPHQSLDPLIPLTSQKSGLLVDLVFALLFALDTFGVVTALRRIRRRGPVPSNTPPHTVGKTPRKPDPLALSSGADVHLYPVVKDLAAAPGQPGSACPEAIWTPWTLDTCL